MPVFQYTARDQSGATLSGALEAPSRRDALRTLAARALTPSSLQEQGGGKPARGTPAPKAALRKDKAPAVPTATQARSAQGQRQPGKNEKLPLLQALQDLTASGLSSGEAIRLLSVRLKEPALRTLCQSLWEQISEGAPLSRALASHPRIFDTSTVNLVAAGEATGSINETLTRIIHHEIERQELRRQIISALAYPVFMMVVALCVVAFFLFYLLPKMQALLSSLGGKLPASTMLLIDTSNFIIRFGPFIAIAALLGAISFWRWRHTEAGRHAIDGWTLRLPVLGSLAASRTVLSISQTLGILLENGITTAEALKMTERQIANTVHREAFASASGRVLEGEALSTALARTHCFPDLVLDRLAVGENTGSIVNSLKDIARSYQKSITLQINTTTRVLTTLVMLGVFSFVGFLAFAIVSAVLSMSASFKV